MKKNLNHFEEEEEEANLLRALTHIPLTKLPLKYNKQMLD